MSANGLAVVLTDLQQRLAALEAQGGGGEELTANYLTLTPGGLVGANFTGLINALGLIIPAAATLGTPPPPQNSVQWQTVPGGAMVANIGTGYTNGVLMQTLVQDPAGTGYQAYDDMSASASTGQVQNKIVSEAGSGGVGAHLATLATPTSQSVSAAAGSNTRTITDQNAGSSFVQLLPGGVSNQTYLQSGNASWPFTVGWNTYPISFPFTYASTALVIFSVLGTGASITGSHVAALNTSGFNAAIDSTINQTGNIMWISIGDA